MGKTVLKDLQGEPVTWLEAIIRAFKLIGRPATVEEIYKVIKNQVVREIPPSAKTPTQTVYGQIYTHSHDSKAGQDGEHVFYRADKSSIWGLVDNQVSETDVGMSEDDMAFREGKAVFAKHLKRERNSALVKKAKENFAKTHNNRLYCEACGFDFYKKYGESGKNYIEAHHMKPIAEMKEGDETRVEDLAMLCANCHRIVHRIRPWISDKTELKNIVIDQS